eukprot:13637425-Alexandrium_andersonii.AAC.1
MIWGPEDATQLYTAFDAPQHAMRTDVLTRSLAASSLARPPPPPNPCRGVELCRAVETVLQD